MNKNEKLYEAIGGIGDDLIAEAKKPVKIKRSAWLKAAIPVAAGLAILIGAMAMLKSGGNGPISSGGTGIMPSENNEESTISDKNIVEVKPGEDVEVNHDINTTLNSEILDAHVVANTVYPVMAPYPEEPYGSAYDKWEADRRAQTETYYDMSIDMEDFLDASIEEIVTESNGKNVVYSPLNVYLALGMLAEITDGSSRQQILDLVGADSVETLRKEANAIWNAHYCNDGATISVLASSLWLNKNCTFKQEPLNVLADNYYASSYQGEMGTQEFNDAFRTWLNENTGGMLNQQIEEWEMTPRTIMGLATTIFYSVRWQNEFESVDTATQTFYAKDADYVCEFMNDTDITGYYWGEKFSAVEKPFSEGGSMYFILPDEGVEIDELLKDDQCKEFMLTTYRWNNHKYIKVNLSVPKFDVSSQLDLIGELKKLGVTDVFEYGQADFSPILETSEEVAISEAKHGARVMIDEEGCVAAAYTVMILKATGAAPEDEIDFVLDQPFIFMIESEVGLPLFVGVVNQPQ